MSRKSKQKSNRKAKPQKTVPQRPLQSSWGAAVKSFLKEFFLNHGVNGYHDSYEEDLSNEGIRKKDLIWGPLFLVAAISIALLPFYRWGSFAEESLPSRIFLIFVLEAAAIGMGIGGFTRIRNAIKTKSSKNDSTK